MSKYHNRKCYADGHKFDSEKERDYYWILKDKLQSGKISNLRMQVKYEVIPGLNGEKEVVKHLKRGDKIVMKKYCIQKPTFYFADFVYLDNETGKEMVIDVKSVATVKKESYKLKKKMLRVKGVEITEVIYGTEKSRKKVNSEDKGKTKTFRAKSRVSRKR